MSDTSLQEEHDSQQHSSGTSLEEAPSADQVDLEDEAISLTELMTPEMHHVKEFEDILQMIPEPPVEEQLKLYDVPEISALFEGAVNRVQKHFSSDTVKLELQNIYQILAVSRRNETSLKDRLQKREDELSQLYQKMRRDPRLYRALVLASSWRREKNIEVQACKEYEATIDVMKTDMKDLEIKIHNLQNVNNRIYKDLQKIPKLEDSVRCLEEVVLKKDNLITILQTELDKFKRPDGQDGLGDADNIKNMYETATAEADRLLTPAQIQRNCKLKMAELTAEHKRQINELSVALQSTRCAEAAAKHNYKYIVQSVKSLKEQLKKLESNLEVSSRKMLRLVEAKEQSEKTIADLEYQIRNMRLREEGLQQLLVTSHRKNERLKAKLGSLATVGKLKFEHENLVKSYGEKEREIAICSKNEHRLEKDLKFLNIQLSESKRLRETQQRDLNNTKQLVVMSKSNLTEAVRYNDVLFKRLEWTEAYLKYYQRRFDACTGDNIDIMNTLKHLGSLCKDHEATIRIKDTRNDSLVLSLSNLEDVLKDAYSKINNLRQANLISQTNHLRQMELNDMMTQLLKFTEAEKTSAVNECNKNVDTVLLLQKQLVQRMNRIAAQYKDICDLKATIEKHLQMLDLQKKETNALRDTLNVIRQEDIIQKTKLKSLTKERDAFGALVIEKNIIVQLLEKKISLLEKLIERGAAHYRHRTDDIRLLKLEVKNLRHKLTAKETTADMNTELRQELVRTCRQLQQEQSKRKAIEELKAPQPHRYLTLKCRDPSQYEQIVKIHKLQRLLIVKYQENATKENAIMARDIQIQQMKLLLVRRIGEDIHEQFHTAKITLSQRNRQIKSLLSEVNVLTFDLKEGRKKLTQVLGELKVAKEEIAKHKRQAIKDSSQHALTDTDSRKRPRMPTDDYSVAFYQSRFKLKPLPIALHHQRQHRMTKQIHLEDRVPDKADQLISGRPDACETTCLALKPRFPLW